MQSKKVEQEFVLLAIPKEILMEAGIMEGETKHIYVEDSRVIIENVVEGIDDFVCGGNCENCYVGELDCDGDCEECPCAERCDEVEVQDGK